MAGRESDRQTVSFRRAERASAGGDRRRGGCARQRAPEDPAAGGLPSLLVSRAEPEFAGDSDWHGPEGDRGSGARGVAKARPGVAGAAVSHDGGHRFGVGIGEKIPIDAGAGVCRDRAGAGLPGNFRRGLLYGRAEAGGNGDSIGAGSYGGEFTVVGGAAGAGSRCYRVGWRDWWGAGSRSGYAGVAVWGSSFGSLDACRGIFPVARGCGGGLLYSGGSGVE